jgi:DNA-binding beta-propeller fold protein YncE
MNKRSWGYLAVSALSCALMSCAGESVESTRGAGSDYSASDAGGGNRGSDVGETPDVSLPPETEESFDLQTPSASRSYVFVANATLNTVARIDSVTLAVTPIDVCLVPTVVRTLPTMERAVVLCEGDHQIAVIDPGDGDDEVRYAWVAEHSNTLQLSPDGAYALAWYDERIAEPSDRPGNPHDLTLIDLVGGNGDPQSYLLSVGFGIRSLAFDSEATTAYVTTEDGLNVVELASIDRDQFLPLLSLGDDPLARAEDREVHITDDGSLAFVRTSTFRGLRVLDLATGDLRDLDLPAVPTDLDLFPGGDLAIAVMRDANAVAVLPLPEALDDPEAIVIVEVTNETIGLSQLAASAEQALLYTTVTDTDHITLLDVETLGHRTYALRKRVTGIVMAPNVDRAIIFHPSNGGVPVPGEPLEDFIAKSWAFTLFDMASGFGRMVTTPTEPDAVVFTEDGEQAFVMMEDRARDIREIAWVHFDSFLVETLEMARPPEAIGIVPATGRVYVSQLADTGRITFIDTDSGVQRHVTAYQLNRRIE